MEIRPYRTGDRAACLAVFDSNVPDFFRREERRGFEAFLTELPGPFVVLTDDGGTIVGCGGVAHEEADVSSLCWGMVHRSRHGEGLGRALLGARLHLVEEEGRSRSVRLETIPSTVGFFRRMGFEVVSTEPDGYAPGMDRVVLVREIRPAGR